MRRVLTALARTGHGEGISFGSRWLPRMRRAAVGLACCLALAPVTAKGEITFTRVVEKGMVMPDATSPVPWPGGGKFGGVFGISPAIDGDNVAFCTNEFVYRWDGQSVYAVNTRLLPLPGTPDVKFAQIGNVAISGTEVAFSAASRSDGSQGGVYATFDGQLRAVATTSTPVPGGTGTFAGFARVARSGDNLAFINASKQVASEWGRDIQYEGSGVYASFGGAAPVVIADTKNVPGAAGKSPFQTFREAVSINGRTWRSSDIKQG
ncbi:MAG TPA: hypothetical protein VHP11_10205 [Tepidisphaeraceae bacterium]|nr:hypothetical protein [Tepidisphaeraceae bacterium]